MHILDRPSPRGVYPVLHEPWIAIVSGFGILDRASRCRRILRQLAHLARETAMSEDEDNGYIAIIWMATWMPVGKKLNDCDGMEVIASAMALLSFYRSTVDDPGLSEAARCAASRELIAYLVKEVRRSPA